METIQQIRCGSVNCFLVQSGRAAILVDTGRAAYREKVLRACRAREEVSVRLIVLTHGHIDHVQNAAFWRRSCVSRLRCTGRMPLCLRITGGSRFPRTGCWAG